MELTASGLLRLLGSVSALAAAHALARRWEPASRPDEWRGPLGLALGALGAGLILLPSFHIGGLNEPFPSSIVGVWVLLQLALLGLANGVDRLPWLCAWGLCLSGPVSIFAHLQIEHMAELQDLLIADVLPAWGLFLQPAAFAVALLALIGWLDGGTSKTLSPRSLGGLVNGTLVAVTGALFLGAWAVPWAPEAILKTAVGEVGFAVAAIQWLVWALKITALWALVLWLSTKLPRDRRWFRPAPLMGLGAINLVLTWAMLAWRLRW